MNFTLSSSDSDESVNKFCVLEVLANSCFFAGCRGENEPGTKSIFSLSHETFKLMRIFLASTDKNLSRDSFTRFLRPAMTLTLPYLCLIKPFFIVQCYFSLNYYSAAGILESREYFFPNAQNFTC